MKTNEELRQLAMREANERQLHAESLYSQVKIQYEQEVKQYIDAKVQQLVAEAEDAIKRFYQGEQPSTSGAYYSTGIFCHKEGMLFPKKHYYYHRRDGNKIFVHYETADTWEKFYDVKYYDDPHEQHNHYYLLAFPKSNSKQVSKNAYYKNLLDEFKKIITQICDEPRIRGRIEVGTFSYKSLIWSVDLGYLDDVK